MPVRSVRTPEELGTLVGTHVSLVATFVTSATDYYRRRRPPSGPLQPLSALCCTGLVMDSKLMKQNKLIISCSSGNAVELTGV